MSSVTRFLRQIPAGQSYYAQGAAAVPASTLANAAYVFVPTAANYVGNYPPGFVAPASTDASSNGVIASMFTGLTALANQQVILRDMGKTIFAQYATTVANAVAGTGSGNSGFFRQVQILLPQPISSTQGFIGGTNGSVFGVYGGSNNYIDYGTIYLPTSVAGVYLTSGTTVLTTPTPQGQM